MGLLRNDLTSLCELKFPRKTGDTELRQPTELHLFCDGSKTCYGFACYLKQEGSVPQLVFAKGKLAPDNKSIPQLELLSVFLALKCIPLILDSINVSVDHIRIWSDAQVVLEWLTSGCKSKSKFTSNRLEDIESMKLKMHNQLSCEISHHYVPTSSNVADMLTRGFRAYFNMLTGGARAHPVIRFAHPVIQMCPRSRRPLKLVTFSNALLADDTPIKQDAGTPLATEYNSIRQPAIVMTVICNGAPLTAEGVTPASEAPLWQARRPS